MATDLTCRFITKPIEYGKMLSIQESERESVIAGNSSGTVFFLEHFPVYTSGLRGVDDHFLKSVDTPVFKIRRGGEVTWHGPGQLVIYPVIHMKHHGFSSVRDFVSYFGNVIRDVVESCGLKNAKWIDDKAGVWIEDRKVVFSGLHFRKFVPIHGFSLNISCDLEPFNKIIPCGIEGLKVTSVELEKGVSGEVSVIAEQIAEKLKVRFTKLKIVRDA